MGRKLNPKEIEELEREARAIELYGRRSLVSDAIERNELDAAAKLCRDAMKEAHYRAKYNCAPVGPEAHKQNFFRIRRLRSQIEHTLKHPAHETRH